MPGDVALSSGASGLDSSSTPSIRETSEAAKRTPSATAAMRASAPRMRARSASSAESRARCLLLPDSGSSASAPAPRASLSAARLNHSGAAPPSSRTRRAGDEQGVPEEQIGLPEAGVEAFEVAAPLPTAPQRPVSHPPARFPSPGEIFEGAATLAQALQHGFCSRGVTFGKRAGALAEAAGDMFQRLLSGV